jgi:hypothetical protein
MVYTVVVCVIALFVFGGGYSYYVLITGSDPLGSNLLNSLKGGIEPLMWIMLVGIVLVGIISLIYVLKTYNRSDHKFLYVEIIKGTLGFSVLLNTIVAIIFTYITDGQIKGNFFLVLLQHAFIVAVLTTLPALLVSIIMIVICRMNINRASNYYG